MFLWDNFKNKKINYVQVKVQLPLKHGYFEMGKKTGMKLCDNLS